MLINGKDVNETEIIERLIPAFEEYKEKREIASKIRMDVDRVYRHVFRNNPVYKVAPFCEETDNPYMNRVRDRDNLYALSDDDAHKILCLVRQELERDYEIEGIEGEEYYAYRCPALVADVECKDAAYDMVKILGEIIDEKEFAHDVFLYPKSRQKVIFMVEKLVESLYEKAENLILSLTNDKKSV